MFFPAGRLARFSGKARIGTRAREFNKSEFSRLKEPAPNLIDLSDRLHVTEVDASELRFLLMNHIPGGALHRGNAEDVIYGAGGEDDFVLKLFHKKMTLFGRLNQVLGSPKPC